MQKTDETDFEISKMVPPGTRKYFFTHQGKATLARDHPVMENITPKIKVKSNILFS